MSDNIKMSISFNISAKFSVSHSDRTKEKYDDNVDLSRTPNNVCLFPTIRKQDAINEDLADVFEEYKQKHPRAKYKNAYEMFDPDKNSHQKDVAFECVTQLGDMFNHLDDETAKKIYSEYFEGFQERNPNLRITASNIHLDEKSPHIHFSFIPYYLKASVKGMDKDGNPKLARICGLPVGICSTFAFQQALGLPIDRKSKEDVFQQWRDREVEALNEVAKKYGYEREIMHDTSKHRTIQEYKEMVQSEEIQAVLKERNQIRQERDQIEKEKEKIEKEKEKYQKENEELQTEKAKLIEEKEVLVEEKKELLEEKNSLIENQKELIESSQQIEQEIDEKIDSFEEVVEEMVGQKVLRIEDKDMDRLIQNASVNYPPAFETVQMVLDEVKAHSKPKRNGMLRISSFEIEERKFNEAYSRVREFPNLFKRLQTFSSRVLNTLKDLKKQIKDKFSIRKSRDPIIGNGFQKQFTQNYHQRKDEERSI